MTRKALFLLLTAAAFSIPAQSQDLTFEKLEFDNVLNANLTRADLVEKVVLVHFWGVT